MRATWKGSLVVLVLLGLAGGAGFTVWRQRQPGVSVASEPAVTFLGQAKRTVTLHFRASAGPLRSLEARVVQHGTALTVLTEDFPAGAAATTNRTLVFEAASLGLKEGGAALQVFARDGLWRPRPDHGPRLVQPFTVDLTPPTVELRTATRYVQHGGAGIAVYRVSGASRSGVRVGSAIFPGVPGLGADPALHVALFTVPYNAPETAPSVFAEDDAGNQRVVGIPVTFLPARFPKDTIRLTEAFLDRKVPELAPDTPATASREQLLDTFLRVNGEGRRRNEAKIREIIQAGSAPSPLWRGVFRQQSNTKVFANYPEQRTYLVDGRTVDTQWHLGIDLASRKQSPVEASNAGRVVFTGANGIFGNAIVIDHGLGLFSLYAHLSEIAVKPGQTVAQGEALGRSGETGLAGGDHLHFATLVHGVYTNPLEWWDEGWIRERIARPLAEAGIALAGVTDGALPSVAPAPAARPVRRSNRRGPR